MSRKFVGRKELNFISAITRELINNVVGQDVVYYQVMAEKSKTNDLYNEAIDKVFGDPIKINALVYFENTTETVTNFPADSKFNIDVYIHSAEISESLDPKMGDFMQFGSIVFEIYTVTHPQILFGQIEQKVMTKCTCGPARQGQFGAKKLASQYPREDSNAPRYSVQPNNFTLKGESK